MNDSGMADLSWGAAAMEFTSMSNAECTQVMPQHSYKDPQDIRMRVLSESAKHRGRWLTPLGLGSLYIFVKSHPKQLALAELLPTTELMTEPIINLEHEIVRDAAVKLRSGSSDLVVPSFLEVPVRT